MNYWQILKKPKLKEVSKLNKNWRTILFYVGLAIGIVLMVAGIVIGKDLSHIRLEGSEL